MKIKISPSDITMGPKDFDLDSVAAMCYAEEYKSLGYRKTSNAYCNIAKIDREDWGACSSKTTTMCTSRLLQA